MLKLCAQAAVRAVEPSLVLSWARFVTSSQVIFMIAQRAASRPSQGVSPTSSLENLLDQRAQPSRRGQPRLRLLSEAVLSAAFGEVDANDLTPPGVDSFELISVRGPIGRRIAVWPGLCLMRSDGPTPIAQMRCETQRLRGVLPDGQLSVWATGALSDIEWTSRCAYHLVVFSPEAVESALSRAPIGRRPQIRSQLQAEDQMLQAVATGLVEEAVRGWPKGAGYAAWFAETLLSRIVETCTEAEADAISGARGLSPRQLARALEMIEKGIDGEVSLPSIAQAAGLSRFHFARAFKRSIGVSPIKHLINRRLDRACQMLRAGEVSVIDVSLACGYDNTSNFTRAFKGRYGVSPTDFVKMHGK